MKHSKTERREIETEIERRWDTHGIEERGKGKWPEGVRPRNRWRHPERRGVGSRAPGLP